MIKTIIKVMFNKVKEPLLIVFYGGYNNYIQNTLKKGGAQIGKGVYIFSKDVFIDPTRPWLLSIGSYTKITHHVIILTHDYSLSVLRRKYGDWIGEGKETIIGENCFIGMNSVILMGSRIGDNVIIGAGSVVRGTIPNNVVVAGNPAKVICTLEEHYNKRKDQTEKELKNCIQRYKRIFGKYPSPKVMEGFKFLFMPRSKEAVLQENLSFFCHGDEPDEVERSFYGSKPKWNSYTDLLQQIEAERG